MPSETPNLLARFCRYVRVDTEAREGSPSYPSTPGQLELGRMLVGELLELGLADAVQSKYGIVTATIPANIDREVPTIAWIAHVDTSPETSGHGVVPLVHHNYDGRELVLPGDPTKILGPSSSPELNDYLGKTIISTDGTTLLGADNKAGVAVIVETAAWLQAHPEVKHGPIRVCFTCDEEIGHGTDHIDLAQLGAVVGYTLDGGREGEIEAETFSADKATITIHGINIHPSIGKGKMLSAVRLAGMFLERLPRQRLTPETTEGREGFIHPYQIEGGIAKVTIGMLLRDFDADELEEQADLLRAIAHLLTLEYPLAKIDVDVEPQYRNMGEGIAKDPRAMAYALDAIRRAGMEPIQMAIRGGTDGSQLTAKGLPTPNLFTSEHNLHSPLEWCCLEEMQLAVKMLVRLAERWTEGD